MFWGASMPFLAKIFGILLALIINFLIGFLFAKLSKKSLPKAPKWIFIFPVLCFIPVVSGIIAAYFGLLRENFIKFLGVAFFSSTAYYALAIYFPFLNISF
jgi:hypothetical protein